jgi:membrane protease YdiL (CAAX protease family)
MVGIVVQLLISWLFLWLFERGNLSVLGLRPTRRRIFDFSIFFFVTGAICAGGFGLKMFIAEWRWALNPDATVRLFFEGAWWNLKSVVFEELIFRGVLFYALIRKLGATRAIWISAAAFGVYHWFSHNAFGNPVAMIYEFVITGAMGLVLAYGYSKTWSLYIPIAIHLGWNLVQQSVFSSGPIGNQLFVEVMPRPIVTVSYFSYFFMQLFPLVSVLGVNSWLIRRKVQAEQ